MLPQRDRIHPEQRKYEEQQQQPAPQSQASTSIYG
jgi:hypothetical protein